MARAAAAVPMAIEEVTVVMGAVAGVDAAYRAALGKVAMGGAPVVLVDVYMAVPVVCADAAAPMVMEKAIVVSALNIWAISFNTDQ